MTASDSRRAYYRSRNKVRYNALAQLIREHHSRYLELLALHDWRQADTPDITAQRREVLFRETRPRRTR